MGVVKAIWSSCSVLLGAIGIHVYVRKSRGTFSCCCFQNSLCRKECKKDLLPFLVVDRYGMVSNFLTMSETETIVLLDKERGKKRGEIVRSENIPSKYEKKWILWLSSREDFFLINHWLLLAFPSSGEQCNPKSTKFVWELFPAPFSVFGWKKEEKSNNFSSFY